LVNYYEHQNLIAQNLITFIRLKGYSKLSFSKLTGISRPTLDQILKGDSPNQTTYNTQISRINEALNLKEDFFLKTQPLTVASPVVTYAFSDHGVEAKRSMQAKELLDGLDNILDIYSMYMK
jgi:transcriptional regulator with XRE-family HTH domain